MTVPQKRAQIALLGRRHPDRWKAIFYEKLQQQSCIPSIVVLFACLCLPNLRRMTHSAVDLELFHWNFSQPGCSGQDSPALHAY
jgi:hypothetical protein